MTKSREPLAPLLFTGGYLVVWAAAGLLAYGVFAAADAAFDVTWGGTGKWIAGGIVLAAAVYELTPLKDVCLGKCRSPLGFLMGAWRDGLPGALRMGASHGLWCLGCCWALMAALFALGVMSIAWMGFVAGLIAAEKILPWRRVATWGTASLLVALGVLLIADPGAIPGLTVPGHGPAMMMS
jgi:predicted metal-binding membrane protein